MSDLEFSVRADVNKIAKEIDSLAYQQLPFATSLALTGLARKVQESETKALGTVFDRPIPFTMKAFGITPARKDTQTATVFAKDSQAKYLAPSEFDEPQYLGAGKKIRTPVDVTTNAAGNIPKGKIAQLLARPDVFMGVVKGVNGIWQRPRISNAKRGNKRAKRLAASAALGLTLLIAFTRPKNVKTHLEYRHRAEQIIEANFRPEFDAAMAKALATAK